ncbi:type I restriction enzyme S subunit [Nitrosomonas ureae]|uniref:restriction endonuclease subunit S n=1 Tax=Nitrosomonas ureae TaxID=44577 RepID=UPI000D75B4E6|nr:restriction endonuclease subunit S [Nitrosomonas ureae]PXX12577.1 type I restriction enzyme S subunit [Nitrosomonas ureae]
MSEWRKCKLSDVAVKFAMGPFGSNIKAENFTNTGVPVIRGTNLNYYRYVDGKFVYLTEEKANQLKSSNCFSGDIVVTHRGTLGQVGLIPFGKFDRYVISQSGMKVTVNPKFLDSNFLLYFFKSNIGQNELLQHESQVGVPSISNPLTSLKSVSLNLPPIEEQKAIASVLSSLDDKIDLLHRQNKTLEAMVETLFRQWFVKESGNWEEGILGDVLELIYGKALKEDLRTGSGYPVVGSSGIVGHHAEYLVEGPGIVIGRKGTLGKVTYLFENFFPIDTTYYIKSKVNSAGMLYEYCLLKTLSFENSDSAVPGLNRDIALSEEIKIPSQNLIEEFNDICTGFFSKMKININQISTLETLRDTLLPKLMSGEVRVDYP